MHLIKANGLVSNEGHLTPSIQYVCVLYMCVCVYNICVYNIRVCVYNMYVCFIGKGGQAGSIGHLVVDLYYLANTTSQHLTMTLPKRNGRHDFWLDLGRMIINWNYYNLYL